MLRRYGLLLFAGSVIVLTSATPGRAQEPTPPADGERAGVAYVKPLSSARVSDGRVVRVVVTCPALDVACHGTLTLKSLSPVAPRPGAKKRIVTLATGSFDSVEPGGDREIQLTIAASGRHRLRHYRSTPATYRASSESVTPAALQSGRVVVRNAHVSGTT